MPREAVTGASPALLQAIERVVRRIWIEQGLTALAAAIVTGSVAASLVGGRSLMAGLVAGVVAVLTSAAVLWTRAAARTRHGAAAAIERADPGCRNIVITAVELLSHPERARPWIRARVVSDAAARIAQLNSADVVPVGHPLAQVIVAAAISAAIAAGMPWVATRAVGGSDGSRPPIERETGTSANRIVAELRPPPYTGRPPVELRDPERIDAVEGTALRLLVTGGSQRRRIRFGARTLEAKPLDGGGSAVETTLTESGYFAIEPADDRSAEPQRLLPVTVSADRAPAVRIDAPGKDLLLPDATGRIAVAASAADDFGLQSLEIRYTRVSGTGEQFEFQEGILPIALTRQDDVRWTATGEISLKSLGLEPGDSLVYRAVGRDRRPGTAGTASSDTFFIEIAGPGQVAIAGFDMPPDGERYALSQQMIVLKIQRLQEQARTLPRDALEQQAANIAAEQRAVRSNFIFLMGGHVEDEEVEAEQSTEIQEGRLQNSARADITAAVRLMGRAEQELVAVKLAAALAPARSAAEALQRAFGRNRYILRTAPVRSRVDPSRRLTGELTGASSWTRELQPAAVDRETREARVLLARLLDASASARARRPIDPSAFGALAERALAVSAGSSAWQQIAAQITAAGEAAKASRWTDVAARLDEALGPVIARAQQGARAAATPATSAPSRLFGAWAEGVRK